MKLEMLFVGTSVVRVNQFAGVGSLLAPCGFAGGPGFRGPGFGSARDRYVGARWRGRTFGMDNRLKCPWSAPPRAAGLVFFSACFEMTLAVPGGKCFSLRSRLIPPRRWPWEVLAVFFAVICSVVVAVSGWVRVPRLCGCYDGVSKQFFWGLPIGFIVQSLR